MQSNNSSSSLVYYQATGVKDIVAGCSTEGYFMVRIIPEEPEKTTRVSYKMWKMNGNFSVVKGYFTILDQEEFIWKFSHLQMEKNVPYRFFAMTTEERFTSRMPPTQIAITALCSGKWHPVELPEQLQITKLE